MSDKKEKLKQNLVNARLMSESEELLEFVQSSHFDNIGPIGKWKQGWAYFTDKKFISAFGLLGQSICIPYSNIKAIGTCTQFLLPMGIIITYTNPENGKEIRKRFSMTNRKKWINLLKEKAGI